MRHETQGTGKGTRGAEGEWSQEQSRSEGVGATGGSGDCQNKEEKGEKGRYYRTIVLRGSEGMAAGFGRLWLSQNQKKSENAHGGPT